MKHNRLPNYTHPLAQALLYTIILFAVLHLTISFFVGMLKGDSMIMNMFHILGVDLIWPELGKGSTSALLAAIMLVIVWAIIAAFIIGPDNKHVSDKSRK